MKNKFNFKDLFVLDLANNHFGNPSHAKKIIKSFGEIVKKKKIKATIKFQFRNLRNFIHPSEINNKKNKYVQRFNSTKLSFENFNVLKKFVKKNSMLTSCTPFDEDSIELIEKMKFDILKIASVSSNDWSLLERSTHNNLPKIISTGGKTLEEVDKIVSFFTKKNQQFAIMHCIAIYPSPRNTLQLNVIADFKNRYPGVTIGWSTHEDPTDLLPSTIAYSGGARIFEKHVGINSIKYKLNDYSSTPAQFLNYLENLEKVKKTLGPVKKYIDKKEVKTLNLLGRGVYAKKNINKGDKLTKNNIYYAFPIKNKQLSTANFSLRYNEYTASKKILKDDPVIKNNYKINFNKKKKLITGYIHQVKSILNYGKIDLGPKFDLEISHHYGVDKFKNYGCFLFNCINRTYAKKIIVQIPNQKHPLHKHKRKEETFQILSGILYSELNGIKKKLLPGDTQIVRPNVWHRFHAGKEGCVFEEVSTTHHNDDSFYKDDKIKILKREQRKTFINNCDTQKL